MALEKKELDNFLPNGFETLNQEGYKENFSEDKIQTGYEKDVPDLVSGPNLNHLIDRIGKNFNVLDGVNKYLNALKIGETPIIDTNNKLNSTKIGLKIHNLTETFGESEWVVSNNEIYKSKQPNNTGHATTETDYWEKVDLGTVDIDLINQSKALETGNVSSNSEVYSDIQNYAHSTFDLSKFTVIGSPTISDDGVASGFSNTNYIDTPIQVNKISTNSFKIMCGFTWNSVQATLFSSVIGGSTEYGIALIIEAKKLGFYASSNGTSWDVISFKTGSTTLESGVPYIATIIFNGSQYICKLLNLNTNMETTEFIVESTSKIYAGNNYIRLGGHSYWTALDGSIDLKSFVIWVDGMPVFNGNKTGLDVIKEDNYEVVGSPTITGDGVFNNNSSVNNLITIPLTYGEFLNKSWEVRTCAYVIPNVNKTYIVFDNNYETLGCLVWNNGLKICAKFGDASDSTGEIYVAALPNSISEGWYNLSVTFNYITGEYTNKAINLSTGTVYSNKYTPTTTNKQLYTFNTKTASTKINLIRARSELITDLNGVQVYLDGNLVYQPCLKIPYIQSITGSKIVDVAYRNRVQNLYQQTGEAIYYTIDEQNQNFTLPAGDIYGMITSLQDNSADTSLTNLTNGLANTICTTAPAVKSYGFIKYGSLIEDDDNFAGFSSTNYAQINTNFSPSNNTWEMYFLILTGANITSTQTLCASSNESIEMGIANSKFTLRINAGSTNTGTYIVLPSTVYEIKIRFTGTQYILSYSTNGEPFIDDIIIELTTAINAGVPIYIGKDYNNNNSPWLGVINKNYASIKVNNQIVWQASAPTNNVYPTAQNPAVVVDGYINGTSGYRVWSDGYCEQWGYVLSVNKTTTITLLKKMIDTNYSITCTGTEATIDKDNGSMNAYNPTTTEFNIYNTSDNVSNCYWKATGYIS